jgi:hypothetical protein
MPFPCHAMHVSFPFDLHSAVLFDSHMPRRASAMKTTMPFCKRLFKATAQSGMGMAWHGIWELASAVHRRHVGDLPAFGFFRLPHGVP